MTHAEARALFPVLERFAYLNAGTLGPLAQPTLDAMRERAEFDQEHGRGGRVWFQSILALRGAVRERIAALIGATPERVALTSSTTDGCNIVIAGLGLTPDDEVVTTDSEHPGLLLPLAVSGARVHVAQVAGRPTAEALERITACVGPKTRLLALSHVLWTTGQVMPVHELKRQTELPVLVDGAQSVGAIEVDVGEVDFYTVSGQKWLCGPEPLGALYVRAPDELRVAFPSYFAQQSIEPDGSFVASDGAARFDSGWLAAPMLSGFQAALDLAPGWRFEHAAQIAQRCRDALRTRYDVIGDEPLGTLVSFAPPGDSAETSAALYERGVVVRDLPGTGWVRASCGWWTNENDIDRLVTALGA
ncbi:MAG: aminotransferase class V-fold PLP-dependent enzyme [Gaiellaceae bacterium]